MANPGVSSADARKKAYALSGIAAGAVILIVVAAIIFFLRPTGPNIEITQADRDKVQNLFSAAAAGEYGRIAAGMDWSCYMDEMESLLGAGAFKCLIWQVNSKLDQKRYNQDELTAIAEFCKSYMPDLTPDALGKTGEIAGGRCYKN